MAEGAKQSRVVPVVGRRHADEMEPLVAASARVFVRECIQAAGRDLAALHPHRETW